MIHPEIEALKVKFDIQPRDLALVRQAGVLLEPELEGFIDRWYSWLRRQPEFDKFFGGQAESLKRVQTQQLAHWRSFFEADISPEYRDSRRRIMAVHARINLPNEIFFAGMSHSQQLLVQALRSLQPVPERLEDMLAAVTKLVFLDTSLATDEISRMQKQQLLDNSKALLAMSTPVTPVWDGILLLPLLGIVDSARTEDIMNKVLAQIAATNAKVFILDILGVATVDTAVANQLIKITQATRLMGCEAVISGISPTIARTMVELGVSIGDVKTTATLKDALAFGLQKMTGDVSAFARAATAVV